ncbi:hypothetical protein LCGC14_0464390 [marine sediment metagenome]|uniref:Uncharacterized protein n=1 Tax=marine sediment metagenome TaxID=412755 RepID=A0A0F9SWT2_9ZZZZ
MQLTNPIVRMRVKQVLFDFDFDGNSVKLRQQLAGIRSAAIRRGDFSDAQQILKMMRFFR